MRILLTGRDGQIGWELQRCLAPLGEVVAPVRGELDLDDTAQLHEAVRSSQPDVVLNAAAYTKVDEAELEPEREHEEYDAELRELARRRGIGDPTKRVRTDRDTDDQVAEQRRQVQTAEDHHDEHRAREQDQHQFERFAHRVLGAARERGPQWGHIGRLLYFSR